MAALATAIQVSTLRGLVLLEPAATFAAADDHRVCEHIHAMSPAYRDGLSREEFRQRSSTGMGFELPALATARDAESLERLRRHRPPWRPR